MNEPNSQEPVFWQPNTVQRQALQQATCRWLAAAAAGQRVPSAACPEHATWQDRNVVGAFVTLRKDGQLRSCLGNFAASCPLGEALHRAACGAVAHDPRFPPVQADELPTLTVELSILHSRQQLGATPAERQTALEIGRHGLDLQYDRHRGLLLPSVPVDRGWSVTQFLEAVCHKAGVPGATWRNPHAVLFRFEAWHWEGPFEAC